MAVGQEVSTSDPVAVLERLTASDAQWWLVGSSLVSVSDRMLTTMLKTGAAEVVDALSRSGLAYRGRESALPAPFDDMSGSSILVSRLGRRSVERGQVIIAEARSEQEPDRSAPLKQKKRKSEKTGTRRKKSSSMRVRMALARKIDGICRYCLSAPADTTDHVVPLSRSGTYSPFNLVGCCSDCNDKKDDLLPKEAGMVLHVPLRWFTADGLSVWR